MAHSKGRSPTGARRRRGPRNRKVRVAVIGVGNCARSFVEGVHHYRDASPNDRVPGLMHVNLGGYHISDIEFSAAIDIDRNKVGRDLSAAIRARINNALQICRVPNLGVKVMRGMTHDGLGTYLREVIKVAPGETVDVAQLLKDTHTDVVVNYLPVGSEEATKWYVEQILQAGCALVNCIPVFIASERYWQRRFRAAGLPVLGDDIKSQVGATILHRIITNLFIARGMRILHMYQLNVGGNNDFRNMLERSRLTSKKISKTNAVASQLVNAGIVLDADDIHVGPSDFVPWLGDNKVCFIRVVAEHFGGQKMVIDVRLSVQDSPNSAGIVIDAVRFAKLALDNGLKGQISAPSSYLFKTPPPPQPTDEVAFRRTESFIRRYGW
ncbi:inositol-3-phosphate synthase [Patescibacteria group bacterium]